MAAALGLGLRAGDLAMSRGTSGTVYSVSSQPTTDPTGTGVGFADATDDATSDQVVVIPYFERERTPNLPGATGMIRGLRPNTTRSQVALAAYDGVQCGLFDGVDGPTAAGVQAIGTLNLIGGGARSRAYQQRCADIRGEPITVPDADEVVAMAPPSKQPRS